MIEDTYHARDSKLKPVMKFLTRRLKMEAKDTRIWSVIVVIIIAILLFWVGTLVYAYLADDVSPTPANERSVPAPRSY